MTDPPWQPAEEPARPYQDRAGEYTSYRHAAVPWETGPAFARFCHVCGLECHPGRACPPDRLAVLRRSDTILGRRPGLPEAEMTAVADRLGAYWEARLDAETQALRAQVPPAEPRAAAATAAWNGLRGPCRKCGMPDDHDWHPPGDGPAGGLCCNCAALARLTAPPPPAPVPAGLSRAKIGVLLTLVAVAVAAALRPSLAWAAPAALIAVVIVLAGRWDT